MTLFSRIATDGRKRRFGAAGLANIAVTNLFLQGLLLLNIPVATSTLCAQLFNAIIGYFSYGRIAFRAQLRDSSTISRYASLAAGLWLLNWSGINQLQAFGIAKSPAALLMIPPLAITSYLIQNHWVFRKP